ncbi:MAG: hypothetical protein ACKV0T_18830 [Planctomycetales bacterium]
MPFRNRVRELRHIPAGELLPHPRNWRIHPPRQRALLSAAMEEIGCADALLGRETADGRVMLIDGHLRTELAPHETLPVLILDVTEDEADKLLATLDPLAAMAETGVERLNELLAGIQTDSAPFQELLKAAAEAASADRLSAEESTESPPSPGALAPQSLAEEYSILITCQDEQQQLDLLERFSQEGLSCRAFVV